MADSAGLTPDFDAYAPMIGRALAHTGGAETLAGVRAELEAGRAWLLPSLSGRSVTVLQPVHDLHVFVAAGELGELMTMERDVSQWAGRHGFDRMTMRGRSGWQRVLGRRGWAPETCLVRTV